MPRIDQRILFAIVLFASFLLTSCATPRGAVHIKEPDAQWVVNGFPKGQNSSQANLASYALGRVNEKWQVVEAGTMDSEQLLVDVHNRQIYLKAPNKNSDSENLEMLCFYSPVGDSKPPCSSEFLRTSWSFRSAAFSIVTTPFSLLIMKFAVPKVIDTHGLRDAIHEAGLVEYIERDVQREKLEQYRQSYSRLNTEYQMTEFIRIYQTFDPDNLIPSVRARLAAKQLPSRKRVQDAAAQRARLAADRDAQLAAQRSAEAATRDRRRALRRQEISHAKNLGRRVCMNGEVIYTRPPSNDAEVILNRGRPVQQRIDGVVFGHLEGFSKDGNRAQIRLSGWSADQYGRKPFTVGTPTIGAIAITPGSIRWSDIVDWYLCDD